MNGVPNQSALFPAGPYAGAIHNLWLVLFWTTAAIFVIVVAVMLIAVARRRSPGTEPHMMPGREADRSLVRTVSGAVVATIVILFVFLFVEARTGLSVSASKPESALMIEVTGHQWWWEVRYLDPDPSRIITTANEIHVPVGRDIMLRGMSDDVIHSFWVPNLQGKRDLIPSKVTVMRFHAAYPGVYRGQCAEYCGLQHAHMALLVVAEPPEKFARWQENQLQPAPEPSNPEAARGREVFLSQPCVLCHTIQGTIANGKVAPDLTHLAARRYLAAGTIPNTPGHLGGWITDSQNVKPGNKMPPVGVPAEDLQPLLAYLESLK